MLFSQNPFKVLFGLPSGTQMTIPDLARVSKTLYPAFSTPKVSANKSINKSSAKLPDNDLYSDIYFYSSSVDLNLLYHLYDTLAININSLLTDYGSTIRGIF